MIKAILFDCDGVLFQDKLLHYHTLNQALTKNNYPPISMEDHLSTYDGLSTSKKLQLLNIYNSSVNEDKQLLTLKHISDHLQPNSNLKLNLELLAKKYKLAVCSNAVKPTVELILKKLDIFHLFNLILTNNDVQQCKPHPEIYQKAMLHFNLSPEEVVVVEDSVNGLTSAYASGANVFRVNGPEDISYSCISNFIHSIQPRTYPWQDLNLNIVMLAAGAGSRFSQVGYKLPKPLIDVHGKPMIQKVIENINTKANYFFIIQDNQAELSTLLKTLIPTSTIIYTNGLTEGAASTSLLAKPFLNPNNKLLISNCDQILNWNSSQFFYKMQNVDPYACLLTFEDPTMNPKWSFCKVVNNEVTEVAEKKPISTIANTGLFYFKTSKDYFDAAEEMIQNNIRVNNEFYVAPTINQLIKNNKKVIHYNVDEFHGIGTPSDLISYLNK